MSFEIFNPINNVDIITSASIAGFSNDPLYIYSFQNMLSNTGQFNNLTVNNGNFNSITGGTGYFTNLTRQGNINIYENITGSSTLSTYQDSLINSMNGSYSVTLPDSTGNIGQIKNCKLLYKKSNTVTVKCSKGSFDLTSLEAQRTLRYTENGWEVYQPDTMFSSSSFYPTTQQGSKLVGSGYTGPARQGNSVCLSADGNTLAVGAFTDGGIGIGSTWIFTRSNNLWTQQGSKLIGSDYTGSSLQGSSVSLSSDGNTLAIGGSGDDTDVGAVWIFTRTNNTWIQQDSKLIGSDYTGSSLQGSSVCLSSDGNTLAIGGIGDDTDVGAVWIFTRTNNTWVQQGSKLIGSGYTGSSRQGSSVSLSSDGNILAVGGSGDDTNIGAVWIFTRTDNIWNQVGSKLLGSNSLGSPFLGSSVSLSSDGNTLAIGGPKDDSLGAVWIFNYNNGWNEISKLSYFGGDFGCSVSLSDDGNTLAVGAYTNHGVGITVILSRMGGSYLNNWVLKNTLIGEGEGFPLKQQGYSVSLNANGNTLAIGGPRDGSFIGATWIFV